MLMEMDTLPRHQCLIYDGSPNLHLRSIAGAIQDRLKQHYRCLYLNSPPLVAGMRSYLAAAGVDVARAEANGSLILSSDRPHLVDDRFDMEVMLRGLESELKRALKDDFVGLWATGDMTWELGPEQDLEKLVEYERMLDEFLQAHPQMGGICQYHAGSLPKGAAQEALRAHPGIFLNQTLSIVNAEYHGHAMQAGD